MNIHAKFYKKLSSGSGVKYWGEILPTNQKPGSKGPPGIGLKIRIFFMLQRFNFQKLKKEMKKLSWLSCD